jgi:hypothetical protein
MRKPAMRIVWGPSLKIGSPFKITCKPPTELTGVVFFAHIVLTRPNDLSR